MLEKFKNLFKFQKETELSVSEKIDNLFNELDEYAIVIRIGEDLVPYGSLLCYITGLLREEIKNECGFIIPEVHISSYYELQENEVAIYIRGNRAANEYLVPNEDGIREEFYDILKTLLYNNVEQIFTNELAERYIDTAQRKNGWLIWNLTRFLSVVDIRIILADIINSGKSINNIGYIFEKIGEHLLSDNNIAECCWKEFNPHKIATEVVKKL